MSTDLYESFYRAFVAERSQWGGMRAVFSDGGASLWGEPDSNGYIDWDLAIPDYPIRKDLESLESEFGVSYPESFKSWFGMYYTMDMNCGDVRLPECVPGEPVRYLKNYLNTGSKLIAKKMLPFAYYEDAGELCFDQRFEVSDPPIVYWEHELSPEHPKAFSENLFSSFDEMIASLTCRLQSGTGAEV